MSRFVRMHATQNKNGAWGFHQSNGFVLADRGQRSIDFYGPFEIIEAKLVDSEGMPK